MKQQNFRLQMKVCCFMAHRQLRTKGKNAGYKGPSSPTILKKVLCLVLQIFLYLISFECKKSSDWLSHTI